MIRTLLTALALSTLFIVGCGKGNKPTEPAATGSTAPVSGPESIDLRPHGLPASIEAPKGTEVKSTEDDLEIREPDGLVYRMSPVGRSLKNDMADRVKTLEPGAVIKQTDDLIVYRAIINNKQFTTAVAQVEVMGYKIRSSMVAEKLPEESLSLFDQRMASLKKSASLGAELEKYKAAVGSAAQHGLQLTKETYRGPAYICRASAMTTEAVQTLRDLFPYRLEITFDSPLNEKAAKDLAAIATLREVSGEGPQPSEEFLTAVCRPGRLRELHVRTEPGRARFLSFSNLNENRGLVRLTLQGADESALHMIGSCKNLTHVEIARSRVRNSVIEDLAALPKLTELDLSGTNLSDTTVVKLANSPVQSLDISRTFVTDKGLASLKGLAKLEELFLSGTAVTNDGLKAVSECSKLHTLGLASTDVTAAGLRHLVALKSLKGLSVENTTCDDSAAEALAALTGLEYLSIRHTLISDLGAEKLAKLTGLKSLRIDRTELTTAGLAALQKSLGKAVDEKSEVIPIAAPTGKPPAIVEPKGLAAADPEGFFKKFKAQIKRDPMDKDKIVEVSVSSDELTDADLAHLRTVEGLEILNLRGCRKITVAAVPYLSLITHLEVLRLDDTAVTAADLAVLAGLKDLRVLSLSLRGESLAQLVPLTSMAKLEEPPVIHLPAWQVVPFLAKLKKLKKLNLDKPIDSDNVLARLRDLTELRELHIAGDSITDRGLVHLKAMKSLSSLTLASDTVTDAGLQSVGGVEGLKSLVLSGRRLTDSALGGLRGAKQLESLRFGNLVVTDRGMGFLREFSELIELHAALPTIGDLGVANLGGLKDLELIDLSDSKVTDAGLKAFKELEELRTLKLNRSAVNGTGFLSIKSLPRLSTLELSGTKLTTDGVIAIGNVESLGFLDLSHTDVNDAAVETLKRLPSLQKLNLRGCGKVTDKAVEALAKFPAIKEIHVGGSGITSKGVADLRKIEGVTIVEDK